MPIETTIIKKNVLLMVLSLFILINSNGQSFSGIYQLVKDDRAYHIFFKDSAFELFSLQDNANPNVKAIDVLEAVGSGFYKRTNDELIFEFGNVQKHLQYYSSDSLISTMSTQKQSSGKTIEVQLQTNDKGFSNNYLIIEGFSEEYPFRMINNKLQTVLPDSIDIKNIFISIMGLGRVQLPFVEHYNYFRYNYYLNDSVPQVRYIRNEVWSLPIKSNKINFFKFDRRNYLIKIDDRQVQYLKNLSIENTQVRSTTESWFK